MTTTRRVLYLFGSTAPPVFDVASAIDDAQARGFDVCLGLTPTAACRLASDRSELERLTGHPVRCEYSEEVTAA